MFGIWNFNPHYEGNVEGRWVQTIPVQSNASLSTPNKSSEPQIPSGAIDWLQARQHVGQTATVYGAVAGSTYNKASNGQPTYIDIGVSYPDTSRVKYCNLGEDRGNFSTPPEKKCTSVKLSV